MLVERRETTKTRNDYGGTRSGFTGTGFGDTLQGRIFNGGVLEDTHLERSYGVTYARSRTPTIMLRIAEG